MSSAISIGASHLAYREIAIEVLELCVGAVEEIIRRYPCEGESIWLFGGGCADLFSRLGQVPASTKGTISGFAWCSLR